MPASEVIAVFLAACLVLAVLPGPNLALISAKTLSGGLNAGLATLAGTSTGLALLAAAAALGTSSILVFMSEWFDVLRWAGALYLTWLGVQQIRRWRRGAATEMVPATTGARHYFEGLAVSLSNPKVLLFLGAFLPQFVDAGRAPLPQLIVLAALFVATVVLVDACWTLLVARLRTSAAAHRLRLMDGIAGALLLAGGLVLAVTRRP